MLSKINTMALHGLDGYLVEVQTDMSSGLPYWEIVGLPDVSIKEAKERVRTAIKNSEMEFPSKRFVINLAPANTKKEGAHFDLPIAIGILSATEVIEKNNLEKTIFIGELSLDGKINKINGILPMCIEALKIGMKRVIIPKENAKEAAIVKGLQVIGVNNLKETIEYLNGILEIIPEEINIEELYKRNIKHVLDFSEVKGQESIKRALEIAAARRT